MLVEFQDGVVKDIVNGNATADANIGFELGGGRGSKGRTLSPFFFFSICLKRCRYVGK